MAKADTTEIYQWQLVKTSVSSRIKHLYNNTLIADVNFCVADARGSDQPKVTVPCHKFVLSISSPVFFTMFYGQMPETGDTIELPDCDAEGFLEFLRYIYCDEAKLTGSCVLQVFYLAEKYMIPSLTAICRRFLEANISAANALDVLPHLDKLGEAYLVDVCWKTIDSNAQQSLEAATSSLLETKELLSSVLERDSLNVKEIRIFQVINSWAEDLCIKQGQKGTGNNKRSIIGDKILDQIRFPLMSQREFAEHVTETQILTESEIVDLFMYFSLGRNPGRFDCAPRLKTKVAYQRCKRFPKTARFWYYNRGLVDAISFSVSSPVNLRGVRLFGSPGAKYFVSLKICGKQVAEGDFQTELREGIGYCGYDIILSKFFYLAPGVQCILEALIQGPKSIFGKEGKEKMACKNVTFRFTTQNETELNGTSVSQGQFAEILFSRI